MQGGGAGLRRCEMGGQCPLVAPVPAGAQALNRRMGKLSTSSFEVPIVVTVVPHSARAAMSAPGSAARAAAAEGKRKRTDLTWEQKVKVLDMNKEHPGTQVQLRARIKRELGVEIAAGTLSELIKKEADIRAKAAMVSDKTGKRDRKAAFPELEDALMAWHKQVRSCCSGVCLRCSVVRLCRCMAARCAQTQCSGLQSSR